MTKTATQTKTGITFLVRGEPGSGKTRFALGLGRISQKRVAWFGRDRVFLFTPEDPALGGFVQKHDESASAFDRALGALERSPARCGGVVIDTITDLWHAEQRDFEIIAKTGAKVITPHGWRSVSEAHEGRLRRLQKLPCHVVLIAEEKPVYEYVNDERREIGTREDTDKKDSYLADVRLRLFASGGKFFAEVLKDRTGRFLAGYIVENPSLEMWTARNPRRSHSSRIGVGAVAGGAS